MIKELKYADREEWLQLRRGFIGGSDAGAVVGMNEYSSPYALWCEKTGRVPGFDGNLTTTVGAYLEDLVARLFTQRTGIKVRRKNAMLVNSEYPWACADVDRIVSGEDALLEIKTTNSIPAMKKIAGGEYPEHWYCQMTHYLAVTGMQRAYLAVLVNCRELKIYTLERDQTEIDALMAAEEEFWTHVIGDTPPVPDGSEATTDTISTIYAESSEGTVELFGRESMLDEYAALKRQKKAVDERISEIENIIKLDMADCERGTCGGYSILWKTQSRSTFQTKALAADHPEIDLNKYYKTTSARPFRVSAAKE